MIAFPPSLICTWRSTSRTDSPEARGGRHIVADLARRKKPANKTLAANQKKFRMFRLYRGRLVAQQFAKAPEVLACCYHLKCVELIRFDSMPLAEINVRQNDVPQFQ
jgi:hypothetical protein